MGPDPAEQELFGSFLDPPPDRLTRARAVIRDERRLRAAIAHQQSLRFDADAATQVRERTEDMLETLDAIGHDDDFWTQVKEGLAVPKDRLERLDRLDPGALPVLLEACGYRTPPPPPVETLVDDVTAALASALLGEGRPPTQGSIDAARKRLFEVNIALRRKLIQQHASPAQPAVLRSTARRAAEVAGYVIPSAAAAAAGLAADLVLPGLGTVLAVVAKKVIEDCVALGAGHLLSRLPGVADPGETAQRSHWRTSDPVEAHAAELARALWPMTNADRLAPAAAASATRMACRHAERISELAGDHFSADPALIEQAALLVRGVNAIDCACPPGGPYGDPERDAAVHARAMAERIGSMAAASSSSIPFVGR